ncbi:MAG TPA: hydrogenase nickel incorporation protein HypB [Myxococcota bacterium]|nr:hydrogenase nickel incorporation protein HypB [Myxococcota bacterium]
MPEVRELDPPRGALVFVENVGNLVCPALFDLGERARVVVASVTEGQDKPAKYPHMFAPADALVLNKFDLLPHVSFDVGAFLAHAHHVNPKLRVFPVSAQTGEGLAAWYDWLLELLLEAGGSPP